MLTTIVQWIIFLVSLSIYLVGATFNGLIGWRTWIRNEHKGSSPAPLLFGLIGLVAVLAAPFGMLADRIAYLWLPFLFDYGSGFYFLMALYYLLVEKKKSGP